MNRNTALLVCILAAAALGLSLYLRQPTLPGSVGAPGAPVTGAKVIPALPVNDIAALTFTQGADTVTLKKDADLWTVQQRSGYPANFSSLSEFLIKLRDLKTVQGLLVGPSQLARLDMVKPPGENGKSGLLVQFAKADGSSAAPDLLIGKPHIKETGEPANPMMGGGFPTGRYLAPAATPGAVSLVSETFTTVASTPAAWLDKTFFRIEKLQSVEVKNPDGATAWKMTRPDANADLALDGEIPAGKQFDSAATLSLKSLLSYATFEDILAKDTPAEQTGLDKPLAATVTTFDGFTYTLRLGKKMENGNYPLQVAVAATLPAARVPAADEKPEDKERLDKEFADKQKTLADRLATEQKFAGWTYIVLPGQLEELLRARDSFLKTPEPPAPTPATPATPAAPTPAPAEPTSVTTPPLSAPAPAATP